MNLPLVYLDTVITSGRVRRDLQPPTEMAAVDELDRLHAERRIRRITSKMSSMEQARTFRPDVREDLARRQDEVSMVKNDHRLLGFSTMDLGYRGFISSPILDDIVDEELFAKLLGVGLTDSDAKHVMYAAVNGCDFFVTLDRRDILPHRVEVERVCQKMRVRTPTELIAQLSTHDDQFRRSGRCPDDRRAGAGTADD